MTRATPSKTPSAWGDPLGPSLQQEHRHQRERRVPKHRSWPYQIDLPSLGRRVRLLCIYCPVCETEAEEFLPYGNPQRKNAVCPTCRSGERHRLIWLYFQAETDLFIPPKKRMLHVAPEPMLSKKFRAAENIDYLSADLHPERGDVQMDLTAIDMPDESFDVIYCSHVLEHIPDDHAAMSELWRILRPNGWAIIVVPDARRREHTIE